MLEPRSMDSLGNQQHTKKLSPKIALHFKVLRESKAMLPKLHFFSVFNTLCSTTTYINLPEAAAELAATKLAIIF